MERGHKILIFSQMTRMLDIIGDYFSFKVRPSAALLFVAFLGVISFNTSFAMHSKDLLL